jgi:uncharacterized protein (TIGR00725 family)
VSTRTRLIVGVMGSGEERHEALAAPVGRWIAREGHHLLTGGGGGAMEAVSEAFASVRERQGLVIGILKGFPGPDGRIVSATPNRWVELPIRTHLPLSGEQGTDVLSRNHLNVLTADAIVVLPGGAGTRSEAELAVRYAKPVVAFHGAAALPAGWPAIPVAATLEDLARLLAPALDEARRRRAGSVQQHGA